MTALPQSLTARSSSPAVSTQVPGSPAAAASIPPTHAAGDLGAALTSPATPTSKVFGVDLSAITEDATPIAKLDCPVQELGDTLNQLRLARHLHQDAFGMSLLSRPPRCWVGAETWTCSDDGDIDDRARTLLRKVQSRGSRPPLFVRLAWSPTFTPLVLVWLSVLLVGSAVLWASVAPHFIQEVSR